MGLETLRRLAHPGVTGPRNLRRLSPGRVRKSKSGKRVSWGQRGKLGKFIGLFNGEWRRWRRAELKRIAKQNSRSMGVR